MFPFEQILTKEEKNDLFSRYASLEEGYIILYLKAEFEKRGYKVTTDYADVRFNLPNGKRKDFDLIIEKDSKRQLILFDNGKMYQNDYFNSLDKVYEITEDIYIITKDEFTLYDHSKRNCFMWISKHRGGIENVTGKLTFNFSTLQWLITNEKLWETMVI